MKKEILALIVIIYAILFEVITVRFGVFPLKFCPHLKYV